MKIYQIHCSGGEWEDRFDYIVDSFISKEKAELRTKELIDEEDENIRYDGCPIYFCPTYCEIEDCGSQECRGYCIDKAIKHCNKFELEGTGTVDLECKNHMTSIGDDRFYRIEEVEVIE